MHIFSVHDLAYLVSRYCLLQTMFDYKLIEVIWFAFLFIILYIFASRYILVRLILLHEGKLLLTFNNLDYMFI